MKPTIADIFEAISESAARQVDTTDQGQAIRAAGMGKELSQLLRAIAGNASYAVAELLGIEE